MKKIARVFPRKTNASPDDSLAFFGPPPDRLEVDEAHISVTFTDDTEKAAILYNQWEKIAPTKIGGPALGDPGGDFVPGLYLKKGYVFTSRGCPNNCWFCDVHKREGDIRELTITNGFHLLDSNILACSDNHIESVFRMMKGQNKKPLLNGGLESKILTDRHVSLLWDLRPDQVFFAYDKPDDLEPLIEAGKKMRYADFTRHHLRCYVLIGFNGDTIEKAEKRLFQAWEAGFMPMAMLYQFNKRDQSNDWIKFQRIWTRPAIIRTTIKNNLKSISEREFPEPV